MAAKVYLVGAGPGDPGLLTWKGRLALARADVVLYDNLANPALLRLAPPDAEHLYVGKKKSHHPVTQDEICALLIGKARAGKTVVRLKGGDPFIFGRGGEEAEALVDAGIPFEVIPGVTTPLGIAAYCGVPLTHREHTSAVTFVTGHNIDAIDWARVGHAETLVLFMGHTNAAGIVAELLRQGRHPDTPAVAVRWATRPDQQCITGTLATIAAQAAALKPPVTFVIGEVVRLRDKLNWYEHLPLFGQRIVNTRAKDQAPELTERLEALGAEVIEYPVIEIAPPADWTALDNALENLPDYDWLLFTSPNAVRYFFQRLDASPYDVRDIHGRICAIGPVTKATLEAAHLKVDLVPQEYVAESVVDAFADIPLEGRVILMPRAAVARDVVPDALRQRGATVEIVDAYRNVVPASVPEGALDRKPTWITFTSSSTVKNFLALAGREILDGVRIASIGPVTSETARKHGLTVTAEAQPHTIEGLVQALCNTSISATPE
ncbi:MAG: uroporphyrinogen-III C-methyltransferase [Bryobacterales bacterium]|nr:uroporphyrinogen-III C-methyltransferase [Bryobacterales bacterium]